MRPNFIYKIIHLLTRFVNVLCAKNAFMQKIFRKGIENGLKMCYNTFCDDAVF